MTSPDSHSLGKRVRHSNRSRLDDNPHTIHRRNLEYLTVATANGCITTIGSLITGTTVILLVNHDPEMEDRIFAEIAWVLERMDQDLALIVVWSPMIPLESHLVPARPEAPIVSDITGDVGRLLAHDGHHGLWLVEGSRSTISVLTTASEAFTLRRDSPSGSQHATAHVIDLGDVLH